MKYHIDTIPVWDAYEKKDSCPLCYLYYKSEKEYVDFFLSGSVMEPSTRVDVNKVGFCGNHFKLLYAEKNRLGLALITHTHLLETIQKFKDMTEDLKSESQGLAQKLGSIIPNKLASKDNKLPNLLNWLDEHHNSCMICDRIDNLLARYAYTILHLWQKDPAFLEVIGESKGFCLDHFALIMKIAHDSLSIKNYEGWLDFILPIQTKALDELEEELLWFTQKFDYRHKDKPWGNSKDALPRTIQKLAGTHMEPPKLSDD